ncbi:MAG: ATP synthase F1 subunit gamma [Ruminococcus sp.]|nr:ATP synthase F1 subunit gamma [Candidatus Copronaster equi]
MGVNTKALRNRIKSVDSTLHLTKAMGLVASSKIRMATLNMRKSQEYSQAVDSIIDQLTLSPECAKSPFLAKRDNSRTRLIVIAGDRGLAGGYNANIFREIKNYPEAQYIPIGKRAYERFGGEYYSSEKMSVAQCYELSKKLCDEFQSGEYDKLGIVYTQFYSMMKQEPSVMWVLPLTANKEKKSTGVIFEPDERYILEKAVPEYLTGKIYATVRESYNCEVVARRMAMDSAGKNAQQMIDDLQLQYNRARQGAITQEITEIIAGSGN